MNGCIKTYTGIYIDPLNPQPGQVVLRDITQALSQTCRWGGHTARPYSVLLHSLIVEWLLWRYDEPAYVRQWALIHDGAEAYLCDMPKPIKQNLGVYTKFEHQLMEFIAKSLNTYPSTMPGPVKEADWTVLLMEANSRLFLTPRTPDHYGAKKWPEYTLDQAVKEIFLPSWLHWIPASLVWPFLTPSVVRNQFMHRWNHLAE